MYYYEVQYCCTACVLILARQWRFLRRFFLSSSMTNSDLEHKAWRTTINMTPLLQVKLSFTTVWFISPSLLHLSWSLSIKPFWNLTMIISAINWQSARRTTMTENQPELKNTISTQYRPRASVKHHMWSRRLHGGVGWCWTHGSVHYGEIMSRSAVGSAVCSIQMKWAEEHLGTGHAKPGGRRATKAEDLFGFHSCQPRTAIWHYSGNKLAQTGQLKIRKRPGDIFPIFNLQVNRWLLFFFFFFSPPPFWYLFW